MLRISFVTMLWLFSLIVSAAAENSYYNLVDKYTECAAINDVVARAATTTDHEYETHLMHILANGGRIVAMIYADEGKISRAVADKNYQAYLQDYTDKLKPDSNAPKSFIVAFERKMEICKQINLKIPDILASNNNS